MTEELKPVRCGCGGEARIEKTSGGNYQVKCANCFIETGFWYTTEAEAIIAWNRAMGERPAKVVKKQRDVNGDYWGKCGECGNMVFGTYCSKCGARLEWK